MTKIALTDDHILLRRGLANLVSDLGFEVILETDNGKQLIDNIQIGQEPDLVLMDINMPIMDGYEASLWIKNNRPHIRILALSMYDDESAIVKMLRSGARGFILKDCEPSELKVAINAVLTKGYFYSEIVTGKLIHSINNQDLLDSPSTKKNLLNDRETEFLKLICSELTYKEIAAKMNLSPRTIDGYRDALFEKLEIKTRTGLALYAIRNGIFKI